MGCSASTGSTGSLPARSPVAPVDDEIHSYHRRQQTTSALGSPSPLQLAADTSSNNDRRERVRSLVAATNAAGMRGIASMPSQGGSSRRDDAVEATMSINSATTMRAQTHGPTHQGHHSHGGGGQHLVPSRPVAQPTGSAGRILSNDGSGSDVFVSLQLEDGISSRAAIPMAPDDDMHSPGSASCRRVRVAGSVQAHAALASTPTHPNTNTLQGRSASSLGALVLGGPTVSGQAEEYGSIAALGASEIASHDRASADGTASLLSGPNGGSSSQFDIGSAAALARGGLPSTQQQPMGLPRFHGTH